MSITVSLKNCLFRSSAKLVLWDAHIGGLSKAGIVSQAHRRYTPSLTANTQYYSKASYVACVYERFVDRKLSVYSVSNEPLTYIEYTHRDGSTTKMMVTLNSQTKCSIISDEDITLQNPAVITSAVMMSLLYNSVTMSYFDAIDTTELKAAWDKAHNINDMYVMCDCFYYAFAKDMEVNINVETSQLITQIKRLCQNNAFRHEDGLLSETLEKAQVIKKEKKKPAPKKQPPLFTEPLETFFDRCKKGEFIVDYQWSDKQKNYIVPLSFLDSFIPTESFRLMLLSVWCQIQNILKKMKKGVPYNEIMGKNPLNIKIMGKPGTGKTTVIEAVLASLGYPKGLVTCKDRMEEDEIEGQNKFIKGTVYNIPTKAGELHSIGGAIVLEEFNLPDPGILQGSLGQALVYPFILKVDGYREFVRHPLTIYFATMNIGTCGSKPMNEALSSRFAEGFILEDVPDDEFINILSGAGYTKTNCRKVYKTYQKILNYLREYHEDLVMSVTLRHCLNALDKISIGFTEIQAYENTFISQIYSSDPDVAKDLREVLKIV